MKRKICFVVASEMTARAFLLHHIATLSGIYEVTLVTSTRRMDLLAELGIEGRVNPIAIERSPAPWRDAKALLTLCTVLWRGEYAAVHSVTPKAGLLAMIAGYLTGVPVRIHTYTGQVWATRRGVRRWLLRQTDRLIAKLATRILVDSASQLSFLMQEGVVPAGKSAVLAHGSLSGVDIDRFRPDTLKRGLVRAEQGIPPDAIAFLLLGRLTKDKGVIELVEAFCQLAPSRPSARLLIVGPEEDQLREKIRARCHAVIDRVHLVDFTDAPEQYMAAADVLCLPSHREGFGSVIIEAAAVGIPTIASRIYGVVDAVEDGVGGVLHPVGDVVSLGAAMKRLYDDAELRRGMGRSARRRALRLFGRDVVTSALVEFYREHVIPSVQKTSFPRGSRILDVFGAAVGMVVLAPLLAGIALTIRTALGSPVLFRQQRPGVHGRPFTLYKFRTMLDLYDASGRPLPDGERLNGLGRFLRSTSLDELPELWNVLRGHMSLVGPRPLLMEYLPLYSSEQARRHEVRPGITGLAQVRGRNALSWEDRFKLDVWYVDNRSLSLDLRILFLTLGKVLGRHGINQPDRATMERFMGMRATE